MGTPCHFALFELQPDFRIDQQELSARYRELARAVHPDRFADAGEREQRQALERSAALNEAYQVLRSAPRRARYLLALDGHELPLEATVQDPEFLLQQMHWRESFDETEGVAALEALSDEVAEARRERLEALRAALDEENDAPAAARQVRALMFIERFARDVEDRLDQQGQ